MKINRIGLVTKMTLIKDNIGVKNSVQCIIIGCYACIVLALEFPSTISEKVSGQMVSYEHI